MKRLIPAFIILFASVLPAVAATPQQMEQAKAAAYRLCLRYMNTAWPS